MSFITCTSSQMLNTGFLQHTPLRTTSLLFFHFDSVPVPLIIQPLLSSPPFLTLQTNFPFPSCNRLSQIGCSSPQGPYCSNLNVALDVLLSWQIANAFSAFLNASSAMKASFSHTRISFRWPTSLYFPLDGKKSFPALLTWWAVSPSGILSTLNAQLPNLNTVLVFSFWSYSASLLQLWLSPQKTWFTCTPQFCNSSSELFDSGDFGQLQMDSTDRIWCPCSWQGAGRDDL